MNSDRENLLDAIYAVADALCSVQALNSPALAETNKISQVLLQSAFVKLSSSVDLVFSKTDDQREAVRTRLAALPLTQAAE